MTDDALDFTADDFAFIEGVRKGFADEAETILAGIGMAHMTKPAPKPVAPTVAPANTSSGYPYLDAFINRLERDRASKVGVPIEKLLAGRR